MSKFYDDDDAVDCDDDVPDFQDEDEFDDYLNDEEFELMNQLFPLAKEQLADYQGWDNLAVKVAIFDHNFELEPALVDLKRRFKKKGMYNWHWTWRCFIFLRVFSYDFLLVLPW